jgi:hypothetical protein
MRRFFLALLCAAPAWALDLDYAQLAARRNIEKIEKITPPATVYAPRYLLLGESPWRIAVSAAIGTEGMHGIRYSWLYELDDKKTKRLFKLPFDISEVSQSSDTVRGNYWLYDCFLCDGPEAGYVLNLPVVVERRQGRYWLKLEVDDARRTTLKDEVSRFLQNAAQKHGKAHRDIQRMKRESDALFAKGLSSS